MRNVRSWCADPGALCHVPHFSPDSAGSAFSKSTSESRDDFFPELVSDRAPPFCLTGQRRGGVGQLLAASEAAVLQDSMQTEDVV